MSEVSARECRGCHQLRTTAEFRVGRRVCKVCCAERNLHSSAERGEDRQCAACGLLFRAVVTSRGFALFCSRTCVDSSKVKNPTKGCLHCGANVIAKRESSGYVRNFCSLACRVACRVGPNSPGWKGGIVSKTGRAKTYVGARPGMVCKSIGVHRLVVQKIIGRLLRRDEFVINIDCDPANNLPENLFVCGSQSEYRSRFIGVKLAWPTESNLRSYK